MAQILIAIIQVNLCCLLPASLGLGTKLTWIIAIKICAINLPSQPLLGRQLGFHNFFYTGHFEQATPFFTAWLFLSRFHFFLLITLITCVLLQVDELCTGWLNPSWEVFYIGELALAELSTEWLGSGWTLYWVTWLWLRYILGDLAQAELCTWLLGSGWAVYWVT